MNCLLFGGRSVTEIFDIGRNRIVFDQGLIGKGGLEGTEGVFG